MTSGSLCTRPGTKAAGGGRSGTRTASGSSASPSREEKLAAKLEKVRQRLTMGASNMTRPGADLIAWYLNPDRLAVARRQHAAAGGVHRGAGPRGHRPEVAAGERVLSFDRLGRQRWDGGVRPDLIARDAHGRAVVIEAHLGDADHDYLGKLVTYAHAVQASVALWAVAAAEPPFRREQLDALTGLNEVFAGRRRFTAVTVTLGSEPSPVPVSPGAPLLPRMRRAV